MTVLNLQSLAGLKKSRWPEVFGSDVSPKGSWRSLYKLPTEKRTADLQWRSVHGATATNRHRAHMDPGVGGEGIFCGQTETLEHLFVQRPRLSVLLGQLRKGFRGLGEAYFWSKIL